MSKKKAVCISGSVIDTYPSVSVIIPVYNGAETIAKCLAGITRQNYPEEKIRVIVVDNDSTDNTSEIVSRFPVVCITEKKQGPSAARNTGIRNSYGEILLFLDADCIADRNLVYEHVRAHLFFMKHDPSVKAVGGGIAGENKNYWAVCDDFASWFLYHPNLEPAIVSVHSTANLSVSRDTLSCTGIFDEDIAYAENFVFCTALIRNGFRIYFHPQAKVHHINRTSLDAAIIHSRNWTKTQFSIREKGYVRRDFLKNELLIILYYFFSYVWQQFFEFFSDILASKRYHIVFYFPFVILIRLQFFYFELKEELRYHRHMRQTAARKNSFHLRKWASRICLLYTRLKSLLPVRIRSWISKAEPILQYIVFRLTGKTPGPSELVLDPVNICNLRCPLCPTGIRKLDFPKQMLDFGMFTSIVDQVAADFPFLNTIHFFSWGEAFLHPEIISMIRYLKKRYYYVLIDVNLSYKKDQSFLIENVGSGLDVLTVSLDGASQETYAAYRRGGDFNRAFLNLRLVAEARNKRAKQTPEIIWKYIIHKHNEADTGKAAELAAEIGVGFQIVPIGLGEVIPDLEFQPALEARKTEWLPVKREYISNCYLPGTDKPPFDELIHYCPFLFKTLVITPDGKVTPCPVITSRKNIFGDCSRERIKTIWNNGNFRHSRQHFVHRNTGSYMIHTICENCHNFDRGDS